VEDQTLFSGLKTPPDPLLRIAKSSELSNPSERTYEPTRRIFFRFEILRQAQLTCMEATAMTIYDLMNSAVQEEGINI
jgi:hypothetical protein